MKKSFILLITSLFFVWTSPTFATGADTSRNEEKEFFPFQNDHSEIHSNWTGDAQDSLNVILSSLESYFKKASGKQESFEDQILLSAQTFQKWFTSIAKSVQLNIKPNAEFGFVPKEYSNSFLSHPEAAVKKIKESLRMNKKYSSYNDEDLTDIAVSLAPIGYDSQIQNFEDFRLNNPWPSQHVQVVAGDIAIAAVSGRLHATMSIVLSLPNLIQKQSSSLGGYALLDRLIIPSSSDGRTPVFAVLNLEFVSSIEKLKSNQYSNLDLPLTHANLKINFANEIIVTAANKLDPRDFRTLGFKPIRSDGGFADANLSDSYVPTERLPYLRVSNLLPTEKIWEPLKKYLGIDTLFDYGFVTLYGFEVDLVKFHVKALSGRLEVFNRAKLSSEDQLRSRTETIIKNRRTCLTVFDKDHCLGFSIEPGSYLDSYIAGFINKYLDSQRQAMSARMKEKYGEMAEILSGSYQAYQSRRDANGSYSKFSENMIKDLCQDGTLDSSDEQCQSLDSGRDR